jgi:hypothetical protein
VQARFLKTIAVLLLFRAATGETVNDGSLDSWTCVTVDSTRTGKAFGIAAGELTGDGFLDIVSGKYFYRNPGGSMENTWKRIRFPVSVDAVAIVALGNDRPGGVFGVGCDGTWWLECTDRSGVSWSAQRIGTTVFCEHTVGAQGYDTGDIVPGGNKEIVIGSDKIGVVYFSAVESPQGVEWRQESVAAVYTEGVSVGDMDNDGDDDICGGEALIQKPRRIWWLENPGLPSAGTWEMHVIGSIPNDMDRIKAADINGDGRRDIVVTEEATHTTIYWFEQPRPPDTIWQRHGIAAGDRHLSMDAADIDGDGDVDVISGEEINRQKILIWENTGSGESFVPHRVDSGKSTHIGCRLADLDNDGDLDVYSTSWTEAGYLWIWRNDAPRHTNTAGPGGGELRMRPIPGGAGTPIPLSGGSGTQLRFFNIQGRIVCTNGYSRIYGKFHASGVYPACMKKSAHCMDIRIIR